MKSLKFALKSIIPITFAYLFVGIAFGIMISEKDMSFFWLFAASTFIYAGSMQIVLLSLMTSDVSIFVVAVMTFVINSRHMFYGIGFIEKFKKMGKKYPYMIVTLTDETYSVMCNIEYPEDVDEQSVDFYIAFIMHMLWIASSVAGYLFGASIPFDLTGIEFSAVTFFVCVVVSQWMGAKNHMPTIIGFIAAITLLLIIGPDSFILPALTTSLIVLFIIRPYIERTLRERP